VGRCFSSQLSNFPGLPTWFFGWEVPVDEVQAMREAVAKEYGFSLYRQYGEAEAAHFIAKDLSTLKRWRRKGYITHINMGERQIRYFGYMIADMLIKGVASE
jgi:hypothetical protein